jgi:RNA polymerase sigma-70 factor, ECF subfamily
MDAFSVVATKQQKELIDAARHGDEDAYSRLVERYRPELHAHCYRMLGSVHDAEDALQDTLLRAWRGLARFEGRSSLRSWLYKIATNTCLNLIARRPGRALPIDHSEASDPHAGPGEPLAETLWVEPYPDRTAGLGDGFAGPESRYEQRESIELAFIVALQALPPNQRAVLILREVLGFSAYEVAGLLETSVPSVNSALQRARKAVSKRLPKQSQQATLRSLADERLTQIVDSYVDAWQKGDVDAVVAMLTEDAAFAMPPLRTWFRGRDAIRIFLSGWPLSGIWDWRQVRTTANGQPALAFYTWDAEATSYMPFALNVFTLRDDKITDVTAFVTRSTERPEQHIYARWPDQPPDPKRLEVAFERFGLPSRLD